MATGKYKGAPKFNMKNMSYEQWRFELDCWLEVTDLPVKKRGIEILLALPDPSEDLTYKSREYIRSKMSKQQLTAVTGYEEILELLDIHLKKDNVNLLWEKFGALDSLSRHGGQTIEEFIADFDITYSEVRKLDTECSLSQAVLACMLIRRSGITGHELQYVMTDLDLNNPDDLYAQAKKALRKFKGESVLVNSTVNSSVNDVQHKGLFSDSSGSVALTSEAEAEVYWTQRGGNSARGYRRGQGHRYSKRGSGNPSQGNPQYGSFRRRSTETKEYEGQLNPRNRYGELLKCNYCGSFRHLVASCPENSHRSAGDVNITEKQGQEEEIQVLFTGDNSVLLNELTIEAANHVILDSACNKTVCGKDWLDHYIKCLPEDSRCDVVFQTSGQKFKFGGGENLLSLGKYRVPAWLADKKVYIDTEVVDSHIPMLMSLSAMKQAGIILDTRRDVATVLGKEVPLEFTSCGHYCLNLLGNEVVNDVLFTENMSKSEINRKLKHLHCQFAHPSNDKLIVLLKNAKLWKKEYETVLKDIREKCDICIKYKRTPSRPVVCLPMATKFNEIVTMDLKKKGAGWIVYFIDMFSRLTVAKYIQRKYPSEVVEAFMSLWVSSGYGIPKSVLSDNGGEFTAEEITEFTSRLNIKVLTTAASSPFSNGLCERNHAVMDSMINKLQAENPKANINEVIGWATCVKNSMSMHAGFSPYQIVFGVNPNLPGMGEVHPPALNEKVNGSILHKHLKILNDCRKAFVEAESCEKVQRALRHKIRINSQVFESGTLVYYKKDNVDEWLGPAKVLFQDGRIVFIRHGAHIVRVFVNRVVKVGQEYLSDNSSLLETKVVSSDLNSDSKTKQVVSSDLNSDSEDFGRDNESCDHYVTWKCLQKNDKIQYRNAGDDPWINATAHSRAGKQKGKYESWWNLEVDNKLVNVDLRNCEIVKTNESTGENVHNVDSDSEQNTEGLVYHTTAENILEAQKDEIKKLIEFDTFEVVDDCGQDKISTRWVVTDKGDKKKARLVARGFEEQSLIQSDSPTVAKSVIRVFLALCAYFGWVVMTTDIKSAFLQGKEIERDVFLQPPKGFEKENKLWKLKKCLYGLNDAARKFYLSVKETLLSCGCVMQEYEPALFVYKKDGVIQGILLSHVDDFLHAGTEVFYQDVIQKVIDKYQISRQNHSNFTYVGYEVNQNDGGIVLSQDDYVKAIEIGILPSCRSKSKGSELSSEEYKLFRSYVGKINWVAQNSRPDLNFAMVELSTKFQCANISHLMDAIKVLKRVKTGDCKLKYPKLKDIDTARIVLYTDASFANLDNSGSCAGSVIFLVDNDGKSCALSWHSGKIKRVVKSTLAAECMALSDGLDEAIYLQKIIKFCLGVEIGIDAIVDNKSLYDALKSTSQVREKRLAIDIASVKECVKKDKVNIFWVKGQYQLADCLTKRGASGINLLECVQNGMVSELKQ